MGVYESYKPLRNQLRRVNLLDSLAVIYAYFRNLQFKRPLPSEIQVHDSYAYARNKVDTGIFEWDLEVLSKEIILNSPDHPVSKYSLRSWSQFAKAINHIKAIDDDIQLAYRDLHKKNILIQIYRLGHRQFPWQRSPDSSILYRNFKIFSHSAMEDILQRRIGLTAKELYTLGLAFTGHYIDAFSLDYPPRITIPGLDSTHVERFVSRFSTDTPTLRNAISNNQSYDEDYLYTLNPLKIQPLIMIPRNGRQILICPILTHLYRRFTDGIYYELFDDPKFSAAFGEAFQKYVGDALKIVAQDIHLTIIPEVEYFVGRDRKDSVDWIMCDGDAALFVECKTKRLRFDSKIALSMTDALDDDLEKMAGFVVQAYRTQADCMAGHYPHWSRGQRQIFPVIVTLDDWYAFGDKIIVEELDRRVLAGLERRGVDPSITSASPYTICAVAGFERAVQIMAAAGIQPFMHRKTSGEKRLWTLESYMGDEFPEEFRKTKRCLLETDDLPFRTQ